MTIAFFKMAPNESCFESCFDEIILRKINFVDKLFQGKKSSKTNSLNIFDVLKLTKNNKNNTLNLSSDLWN